MSKEIKLIPNGFIVDHDKLFTTTQLRPETSIELPL